MVSVVAFLHTYAKDRELGSYMNELVDGFVSAGIRLHLIMVNDLVNTLAARGYRSNVSDQKIIQFIKALQPIFVFTTNRGGITKRIMAEIDCPIITWMVDRIPFLHHGGGHDDLFCDKDLVVTSSYKNVARLETIYPVLKGRVYYLPFATNVEDFSKTKADRQDINISFVGTYFYCGQFTKILETYHNKPKIRDGIIELARRVELDYDLDFDRNLQECGVWQVLQDFNLDIYKLKGLIANTISLNDRIKALDAVSDYGLKLYGTDNWLSANQYSLRLLRCFQFDVFIKTREQLVKLYQRSKIALNVSHAQAVDGLPYRTFDIMASDALLLTNYRENSDLFKLFGDDMPVPMYRSNGDLRDLVSHYLSHEDERRDIVMKCQKLVAKGFSFKDRVLQFLDLVGVVYPSGRGELVRVDVNAEFHIEGIFVKTTRYRLNAKFTDCMVKNLCSLPLNFLVRGVRTALQKAIAQFGLHSTPLQRQKIKALLRRNFPENFLYWARDFVFPELRGRKIGN